MSARGYHYLLGALFAAIGVGAVHFTCYVLALAYYATR